MWRTMADQEHVFRFTAIPEPQTIIPRQCPRLCLHLTVNIVKNYEVTGFVPVSNVTRSDCISGIDETVFELVSDYEI